MWVKSKLPVHPDASRTNHPERFRDKAAKTLAAVTESLLPFINGPSRLQFVN